MALSLKSPPVSEEEKSLRARCRDVELDGPLREYGDTRFKSIHLGDFCTIIETTNCALCKTVTAAMSPILTHSVLKYAEDHENTLRVFLHPSEVDAALEISFHNFGPDGKFKNMDESIKEELILSGLLLRVDLDYLHKSSLFNSPKQLPSSLARMKHHLRSLTLGPPGCRYITKFIQATKESFQTISATLGERYLWVDSLCIIQDDRGDKDIQISQMDKVYSVAIATIVAASETDPSRGLTCLRSRDTPQVRCFPPLQRSIDNTLWNSRGWTYQEFMLSRRLIIFTSTQLFFSCTIGTRAEDTIYSIPNEITGHWSDDKHMLYHWTIPGDPLADSCWELYNNAAQEYTKRNLTWVLRSLGRYCNDIFLCGLPVKQLPCCLLWHPTGWSWVEEAFDAQRGYGPGTCVSKLENLRFRGAKWDELPIDQTPSDDELMNWPSNFLSRSFSDEIQPIDRAASFLDGTDETFGQLLFRAEYRILHYDNWIGTVFLTPDCAASYPTATHDCEFIRITNCAVYTHEVASNLLHGFGIKSHEPDIFDPSYYKLAGSDRQGEVFMQRRHGLRGGSGFWTDDGLHPGIPKPPKMYLSHVMLLERKGSSVYRRAVGLIVRDQAKWTWGDFCLE
ncbi:heterokaryon incompatibility protein-domain-containing protein [Daldinia loculata]|uniref:heterokaryon incompatibility protein-domain-containing protein n=1 Tax=Daldinia loculata TaxID=103429 RepID=UPI0020C429BD|nr:heterokaryon incompatibility protein-domain-containing protein [Daldinia loculata]KAI1650257.1 heterokaryon incompatibility protein-domain-containing protein [Daldinia loculata]